MNYSIEQEIKSMLTFEEFASLLDYFNLSENDFVPQQNSYYDTKSQLLKQAKAAYRLRNFSTTSEWTFKQQQDQFRSLELTTSQTYPIMPVPTQLTLADIEDMVIHDQLSYLISKQDELQLFLQIKTERFSIANAFGELAIDRTYYGNFIDYEIELETSSIEEGHHYLMEVLGTLDIPFRPAEKKIKRALTYLNQFNNQ